MPRVMHYSSEDLPQSADNIPATVWATGSENTRFVERTQRSNMAPSGCMMRIRIIFAVIGVLIGISIFPTFGIVYKNWDTAVWGLMSGNLRMTIRIFNRFIQ